MIRTAGPRTIGYARVSTRGQDLAYQIGKLRQAGCVRIFDEKRSGKSRDDRPELARALQSLQQGDLLLATATDRVARDPVDLLNIFQMVRDAGANLRLLDEPFIDTTSEMADLVVFLVGWAARWHRRRILENTAAGRELARQRGIKFGRKPKLSTFQRDAIKLESRKGRPASELAKVYNVSTSTILRCISRTPT